MTNHLDVHDVPGIDVPTIDVAAIDVADLDLPESDAADLDPADAAAPAAVVLRRRLRALASGQTEAFDLLYYQFGAAR